ncbi:DUF4320 family protein [Paenibacillus sp. LjRoot153]|uniref:DUF4320 family protein n=1 Tax=Paenibacillus sp. LjRoot153 TaxID=3342270 RepID=UPI003ECE0015
MKKILYVLRSIKGEGMTITIPILILLFAVFTYFGLDVYGYMSTKQKIRSVASETLEIMKADNGYSYETEQYFEELARDYGLDPSQMIVTATPQRVQRGATVSITIQTTYKVLSLKPFGKQVTAEIDVFQSGLAHTYFRS